MISEAKWSRSALRVSKMEVQYFADLTTLNSMGISVRLLCASRILRTPAFVTFCAGTCARISSVSARPCLEASAGDSGGGCDSNCFCAKDENAKTRSEERRVGK